MCGSGEYEDDFNMIFFCDNCNISVHKRCYGIPTDIGCDEKWLCNLCQAFKEDSLFLRVQCSLCGHPGGAMRPTNLEKAKLNEFYDNFRQNPFEPTEQTAKFELFTKVQTDVDLKTIIEKESK